MNSCFVISLIVFSTVLSFSHARQWTSADGGKTIEADFVSRDASSVTLRMPDGQESHVAFTKLAAVDLAWLKQNHPLTSAHIPEGPGVFDTLKFGDNHNVVLAKLKASKLVELTMPESMIARTGLNGIFRMRQLIGGQHATLFFDWTGDHRLKEIIVRTDAYPADAYDQKLAPCWNKFTELLTTLHGKPLQAIPHIDPASVPDGSMVSSHLWRLESGGSALLGIGCEGSKYQVVVRFTKENIEPVTNGRPAKPVAPDINFEP